MFLKKKSSIVFNYCNNFSYHAKVGNSIFNILFSSTISVIPQSSLLFFADFNPCVSDVGFSQISGNPYLSFILEALTGWLEALCPWSRLVQWSKRNYTLNSESQLFFRFPLRRICQSPAWEYKLDGQYSICLVEKRGWSSHFSVSSIHLPFCFQLYLMSPVDPLG